MTIRAYPLHLPLRQAYLWAKGEQRVRQTFLVEQQGSWGECAPPPHQPRDAIATTKRLESNAPGDARERCGLEQARLAGAAVEAGERLADFLGDPIGRRPRAWIPVNALLTAPNPDAIQREAQGYADRGFSTFKIKVGGDQDFERVQAVRDLLPNATIRIDANEAWDLQQAAAILERMATLELEYVEQPVPTGTQGMHRLQEILPIALDEEATDASQIAGLGDRGSHVILKPQRLGGPEATLDAILAAEDAGLTPILTNSLETNIGIHHALHLASLLQHDHACGLATSDYFQTQVGPTPYVDLQARMHLPTGPGLGVWA